LESIEADYVSFYYNIQFNIVEAIKATTSLEEFRKFCNSRLLYNEVNKASTYVALHRVAPALELLGFTIKIYWVLLWFAPMIQSLRILLVAFVLRFE